MTKRVFFALILVASAAQLSGQVHPSPGPGVSGAVVITPPSFVAGQTCSTPSAGTQHSIGCALNGTTSGNAIVIVCSTYADDTAVASDGTNVYTRADISTDTVPNTLTIHTAPNIAGGNVTPTCTIKSGNAYQAVFAAEYTGVASSNIVDNSGNAHACGQSTTAALTTSNITTTTPGTVLVGGATSDYPNAGATFTAGSIPLSFTRRTQQTDGSSSSIGALEDVGLTSTGATYQANWTVDAGNSIACAVALRAP